MSVFLILLGKEGNLYLESIHKLVVFTNIIISAWKTTLRPPCGHYRDSQHNTKQQKHT